MTTSNNWEIVDIDPIGSDSGAGDNIAFSTRSYSSSTADEMCSRDIIDPATTTFITLPHYNGTFCKCGADHVSIPDINICMLCYHPCHTNFSSSEEDENIVVDRLSNDGNDGYDGNDGNDGYDGNDGDKKYNVNRSDDRDEDGDDDSTPSGDDNRGNDDYHFGMPCAVYDDDDSVDHCFS